MIMKAMLMLYKAIAIHKVKKWLILNNPLHIRKPNTLYKIYYTLLNIKYYT